MLVYNKVPKVAAVVYDIPGTKYAVLLSFTATIESDDKVCPRNFWSIQFSCVADRREKLPPVNSEKWGVK